MIFHIDVNSAYLSWTAVEKLQYGEKLDIRSIPSAISGNPDNRHGIILAKSNIAKKYGVDTGEDIFVAKKKCPQLQLFKPDYDLYLRCSNSMVELLKEYSPNIQRYSVDECFIDGSHFKGEYLQRADEIRNRIEKELGFTVNIGISTNKLLAKMASDFEKPNKVHTLFEDEIEKKMWPLDVGDLFMVGKSTKKKLNRLNIYKIGDLANYDPNILRYNFKSFGELIYNYANGKENSPIRQSNYLKVKGVGNSITTAYDINEKGDILKVILSLVETTSMRLREIKMLTNLVVITIKTNDFIQYSHQKSIGFYTDSTMIIYEYLEKALEESWKGERIRQVGVRVGNLCSNEFYQESIFSYENEKLKKIDSTIDKIRNKYGKNAIVRGAFLHSDVTPMSGGVGDIEYPMMSSIL